MKKILALLAIPVLTLTGCAKYDKPVMADYYCQKIINKMHSIPEQRYKSSASNKRLATELAKLRHEYYHYDCELYQYHKDIAG